METNKNNEILIQENQTKLENTISCERCKNSISTIFCEECKPFHYFCDQCDTAVHELISRKKHHRENLSSMDYYANTNTNKNSNHRKTSIDNNSTQYDINTNNIINYSTSRTFQNSDKKISRETNDKIYSKEYIDEINNLHQKEKEELIDKISSMQNSLNKIKSTLNDEISKIKFTQLTTEKEYNDKIDKIKFQYESKINSIQKETEFKNKEISNLNRIILEQKKLNGELASLIEQLKIKNQNLLNDYTLLIKENNLVQKISKQENETLNIKLKETIDSYDNYKKSMEEKINEIKKENEKNIEKIKLEYDSEINDIKILNEKNYKNEMDELQFSLEDKYEKIINEISEENNILKQDNLLLLDRINNIENQIDKNKNEVLMYEKELEDKNKKIELLNMNLDKINYIYNEANNIINDLKNKNEYLKNIIEEKNKEFFEQEKKVFLLNNEYNNSIKNMQNIKNDYTEKIKELKEENKNLKNEVNKSKIEYENKIKNFKFIEERNAIIEKENEQLKLKIEKFIEPPSFNYAFLQK